MASGKVIVVLYAMLALAASVIDKSSDVTVAEIQTNVCPGDAQPSGTECVTSCLGHANGDYQSCTSCHMYVTCSNGITYKDRPCPANLVWDDEKKRCTWKSTTCPPPPPSGVFYMNLEDSDLGEDYIDGTTWQMLPGVPDRDIPAPTATGACDTAVLYKFTPPACIKSVRFQITTNASAEEFVFGVVDDDDDDVSDNENGRTVFLSPAFSSALVVDYNNMESGVAVSPEYFTTPLCGEIKPGVVSYSSTDGGGYTFTAGDKFYQRMGVVPFTFAVNVDPFFMMPRPGVCSLKVAWSC